MQWYLDVLTKKYAEFEGRARRQEYWMFVLFNVLVSFVLGVVDAVLQKAVGFGFLGILYTLAILVPSIAVAVRRLHDIGKSGWWILIGLVPCVGIIVLIVFYCQDSQPGSNEFGPNPKGAGGGRAADDYDDR